MDSDLCPEFRTVQGHIQKCRRSAGHTGSPNPRRREHYAPDGDHYWQAHDTKPHIKVVGHIAGPLPYRAVCVCGATSRGHMHDSAMLAAERHLKEVELFADANGLIIEVGDTVRAKLTTFDGPSHLFGQDLRVAKRGRLKIQVRTDYTGDHTWAVTASTMKLVGRKPIEAKTA